ncbi:hypothetical protein BURPS305_3738 [Burkholderia pseudomallei 305]|nr:hypothetical protein BURPS305_3738 [Burkholderia pseudomallei 305]
MSAVSTDGRAGNSAAECNRVRARGNSAHRGVGAGRGKPCMIHGCDRPAVMALDGAGTNSVRDCSERDARFLDSGPRIECSACTWREISGPFSSM